MTERVRSLDYSGNEFGLPNPRLLSKAWRLKHGVFAGSAFASNTNQIWGQDSVDPAACRRGLPLYGGYYNGTYANLNEFRALYPNAMILSITPDGMLGARCIDCEPGDATPWQAAQFVRASLPVTPSGGRNDGGRPMVYCSAGDAQAVINEVSALGIARQDWDLWTAHWIGQHVCSRTSCGYPNADGTQWASNQHFDSDVFYTDVFGPVVPPSDPKFPLKQGDKDVTANGPVHKLQERLNVWSKVLKQKQLTVDGDFGPVTAIAVGAAQQHFGERGTPAGTADNALFLDLSRNPNVPPPPPVKPPLPVGPPPQDLTVVGAGAHSVAFEFKMLKELPRPAWFQVKVMHDVNGRWGQEVYTRVVQFGQTGTYHEQYGGLEPQHKYFLLVRTFCAGHNASPWAEQKFETAK